MPRCVAAPAVIAVVLVLTSAGCGSGASSPSRGGPPEVTFTNGSGVVSPLIVEIADTPEKRSQGLMGRESLAEEAGMLFVWPEDTTSGFWMKDTLIPLSVAFIDAQGRIVGIQDMQPLDETLHRSPEPYRYAVEANQGWFAAHGITAGDAVSLPSGVATPRS